MLSLSTWRDEKSVVRWRTQGDHHGVQEKGRFEIFEDYHLRVGEVIADSDLPQGLSFVQQRFDETEIGEAKAVTISELSPPEGDKPTRRQHLRRELGLPTDVPPASSLMMCSKASQSGKAAASRLLAGCRCGRKVGTGRDGDGQVAPSPGPRHPRLRHVRSPRGAAILSGGKKTVQKSERAAIVG